MSRSIPGLGGVNSRMASINIPYQAPMTDYVLNARTVSNDAGGCFGNVEHELPTICLTSQCNRVCSKGHQQGFSDVVFRGRSRGEGLRPFLFVKRAMQMG